MHLTDLLAVMTSKDYWTLGGYVTFAVLGIIGVVYKVWSLDHEEPSDGDDHGHH